MTDEISEQELPRLLETFYRRVRADPMLGPVFEAAVDDWPSHLALLARFWSSVMLTSGRYKGNPVAAHMRRADQITPDMFKRWLELWTQTTGELLSPKGAAAMQSKARRIGESLQLALAYRTDKPIQAQ